MKLKYCPNCACMDIKRNANGTEQCTRCGYIGEMKEGSIDEINAARKRAVEGSKEASGERKLPTNRDLRERLEKLKGKKDENAEIF